MATEGEATGEEPTVWLVRSRPLPLLQARVQARLAHMLRRAAPLVDPRGEAALPLVERDGKLAALAEGFPGTGAREREHLQPALLRVEATWLPAGDVSYADSIASTMFAMLP